MCVVLFYLSFRLLRLCVTITNLRDDEGRNSKQIVLYGGIEPPDYPKNLGGIEPYLEKGESENLKMS
jgi:hypothetical protein